MFSGRSPNPVHTTAYATYTRCNEQIQEKEMGRERDTQHKAVMEKLRQFVRRTNWKHLYGAILFRYMRCVACACVADLLCLCIVRYWSEPPSPPPPPPLRKCSVNCLPRLIVYSAIEFGQRQFQFTALHYRMCIIIINHLRWLWYCVRGCSLSACAPNVRRRDKCAYNVMIADYTRRQLFQFGRCV